MEKVWEQYSLDIYHDMVVDCSRQVCGGRGGGSFVNEGVTCYSVLERSLRSQWTSLSPFTEQVLRETGPATQGLSATIDDFKWAYSIFWYASCLCLHSFFAFVAHANSYLLTLPSDAYSRLTQPALEVKERQSQPRSSDLIQFCLRFSSALAEGKFDVALKSMCESGFNEIACQVVEALPALVCHKFDHWIAEQALNPNTVVQVKKYYVSSSNQADGI